MFTDLSLLCARLRPRARLAVVRSACQRAKEAWLAARRRELLPVAGKVPFDEVVAAIREHAAALKARSKEGSVGQRMTVAWVLLGGVNHGDDEVDALARLF